MDLISWSNDLSVNNSIIDEQHQNIIRLTNNLILNANANLSSHILLESLTELIKYYKIHFEEEERFLEEKNYPHLSRHKDLHKQFKYDVAMFSKDILNRDQTTPQRIVEFLVNWVINHVSIEDQEYKKYI